MPKLVQVLSNRPVIAAGLFFIVLGSGIWTLGHVMQSATMVALGLELSVFDGLYAFLGGGLSHTLERSEFHWVRCHVQAIVEIVSLFGGTAVFAAGLFTAGEQRVSGAQTLLGLVLAPVVILANVRWHRRIERQASTVHHHGFAGHMLNDAVLTFSVAAGGLTAYLSGRPDLNLTSGWIAVAVALGLSIVPAYRIVKEKAHTSANHHDAAAHSHHHE